jgi:hypothetical protein
MTAVIFQTPYFQAPLDLTGSSFRLVELQPCSPTDIIKCHLTAHPSPPDCPPFVALSYMWDHTSSKDTIHLNGTPFLVGHSLWTFLNEMRSRDKFQMYWIDAICINQSNIRERNHQVQLMNVIYSQAKSVYIWLGLIEERCLSIEAMEFLKDVDSWHEDSKPYLLLESGKITSIQHDTIVALCQYKYWDRMWIFQEVVLAREATIYIGPCTMRLVTFQSIIQKLEPSCIESMMPWVEGTTRWAEYDDTERVGLSFVCDLLLYRRRRKFDTTLRHAIQHCRARKATDVRDRIYGLFGVLQARVSSIGVDYHIEPIYLWIKVFAYVCRNEVAVQTPYILSIEQVGERLAEALELEISYETIRKFIETQKAIVD